MFDVINRDPARCFTTRVSDIEGAFQIVRPFNEVHQDNIRRWAKTAVPGDVIDCWGSYIHKVNNIPITDAGDKA